MMHHDFFYQDYEFQDYPAEQPLPDRHSREQHVQEHAWKALQVHPVTQAIRLFEIAYQKYPREMNYLDPLRRLMIIAYGAHPLFGADETLRLAGLIRILTHAESEFEAMTLASDTFARYAIKLPELQRHRHRGCSRPRIRMCHLRLPLGREATQGCTSANESLLQP
jgi:hypothetical protein